MSSSLLSSSPSFQRTPAELRFGPFIHSNSLHSVCLYLITNWLLIISYRKKTSCLLLLCRCRLVVQSLLKFHPETKAIQQINILYDWEKVKLNVCVIHEREIHERAQQEEEEVILIIKNEQKQ